jgi:hypothetical protein
MNRTLPAVVAMLAAHAAAQDVAHATDAEAAFARQCAAILPTNDELAFRAVPWQTELRTALAAGNRDRKPVLLWAMNGHPCGQT